MISAGVYGYPKDEAINIAIDEIKKFLEKNEMDVYLTIINTKDYMELCKLLN